MAAAMIKRLSTGVVPIILLFGLLLVSLYLMGRATQNSEEFGRLYVTLLVINVSLLILLMVLIGANMLKLWRQYRNRATGVRLTMRLVVMFVVLAMVPVSMVYWFSLDFIKRGIDSWFDVHFEKALEDALELSRTVLDSRMRDLLRRTEAMAGQLDHVPDDRIPAILGRLSDNSDVGELTVLTVNGKIIASTSTSTDRLLPTYPEEAIMLQLRQGMTYAGLDQISGVGLNIRVVVPVKGTDGRILQVLYPVSERLAVLTDNVQSTYARYDRLRYLRDWLKFSFALTLSLVLLLSLLTAVWAAFYAARRLVAPIRTLAIGTRAVAAGDYRRRLPLPSHDEFGVLVQSFNDMTGKIALAQDQARHSQQQVESQRAYLEAVLERLSSGVLALDSHQVLRTANAAAGHILGVELNEMIGMPLSALAENHGHLAQFVRALTGPLAKGAHEWREEVTLFGAGGRQVLICGGASLPGVTESEDGYVVVFEDVTTLIQAQRDAAWGEMARRLAHEIKNPLTPIRLSAERLRHKYLKTMPAAETDLLDRSTHTIIQQVEAMQEMVKAFSDYARVPKLDRRPLDLNMLINEVLDLYRDYAQVRWELRLQTGLPAVEADVGRFRQLLHNLFKNALEALGERSGGCITITTQCVEESGFPFVELEIGDNGPGFPAELLGRLFEPYVTTKPKGTGLGLAIVKKIVDEHGGMITAENTRDGACVVIRFPLDASTVAVGPETGVGRASDTRPRLENNGVAQRGEMA
ncbi:MAG: ATP-binding protein [Gammaproteobacteria bacterium]|jgi:nitrogen fixation/metabolism regulation signal transduction histidine kinase